MNILHLSQDYFYTSVYKNLIKHLNNYSIKNRMIVFSPYYDDNKSDNLNVINFKCTNKFDRFYIHVQRKTFKALLKKFDFLNVQLVHAHFLLTDGYIAYRIKEKYKIPYIVAIRNSDININFFKKLYFKYFGIKILKNAENVIFLSDMYRKNTINKYIPNKNKNDIAKKSLVIPNGIDEFWFQNINKPKIREPLSKLIKLIYIGTINENKNILTTVKASIVLQMKGYDVRYTIVGDIKDLGIYDEIKKYNFITYIEAKPKEELIEILRNNDIFIMPSITETFGLVYAEALSQGIPVIYSRGQGFDKQFEDGEIGYSVNCFDEFEIAQKIVSILENYSILSRSCIKLCWKFNWDDIAQKYVNIYTGIVSNTKK